MLDPSGWNLGAACHFGKRLGPRVRPAPAARKKARTVARPGFNQDAGA